MGIQLLASVLGVFVSGSFVALALLWRKNKALQAQVTARKSDLNRTSRILIEKNLELVDQTIVQQKMLETKDDFISIVSHQLRTPATEIKWNIDSMLRDSSWQLDSPHRASLETLYSSVEHMISLINNIVHLVTVEQGVQHLATVAFEPDPVIRFAAEQIAKDFSVVKKVSLSINAAYKSTIDTIDPDSLSMVISNLVENAYYYSREGGAVRIQTTLTPRDELCIVVQDDGIGMSTEQQKAVFQKFRRSQHAIKLNARGSGLGLYIVKKILAQHQGTIVFESTEGVGTTFTLTLPRITGAARV